MECKRAQSNHPNQRLQTLGRNIKRDWWLKVGRRGFCKDFTGLNLILNSTRSQTN